MAKDSRALTLKLLADVDNFTKNLNKADNEVSTFGGKVSEFGKKAGLAFAAAGAAAAVYAGKLLVDGVQAAIADEKANALLANTLRNVAGATDEAIEETLAYTRATELATGVTEDELRPSLNRLAIATGDVSKAMELQKLALDVSAGSGKSLEAVTQALARAQEGNTASLGRLGIGLSAAQLKTMSMNDVTSTLADTFAGAADTAANTFEGKMTRLGLAFEDVRDTVGGFVLDTITPMVETFVTKVMPALSDFATSLSERVQPAIKVIQPIINGLRSAFNSVRDSLEANNTQLQPFYDFMVGIFNFAKDFLAPVISKTLGGAFTILGKLISGVITTFAGFVNQLNNIFERITGIINAIRSAAGAVSGFFGGNDSPTPSTPRVASPKLPQVTQSPSPMNITVNGAIDPEGTARTIVNVLNNSQARGTLGAAGLVGR
jgi:hypothetical protein